MTGQGAMPAAMAERIVDAYIHAWNLDGRHAREALLAEIWAADGRYVDPRADLQGPAALVALLEERRAGRPGAGLVRSSAVELHHDVARFAWHLVTADGLPQPECVDFIRFDADGRLALVVGFFGPQAPLAASAPGQ